MNTYQDYYTCVKRRTGRQPDVPRFWRRQCLVAAGPPYPLCPIPPGPPQFDGAETPGPWTVVVECDAETGIVRYVIDGERCLADTPGPEQEANRALIAGALALRNGCWAALGYLRTPPEERHYCYDRELVAFLEEVLDAAEGRTE